MSDEEYMTATEVLRRNRMARVKRSLENEDARRAMLKAAADISFDASQIAKNIFLDALIKREEPDWRHLQAEVESAVIQLEVEWLP